MGPSWSQLRKTAADLLRAVADSQRISLKEVIAFADAVLASRAVVLAEAVRDTEPEHVLARAVELAACLLAKDIQETKETYGT